MEFAIVPKEKLKQKLNGTYAPVDARSSERTYAPVNLRRLERNYAPVNVRRLERTYAPISVRNRRETYAPSSSKNYAPTYAPSFSESLSETVAPQNVYGMRNVFPSLSEVFAQQIPGIAESYVYDISPVFPSFYEQKPDVKVAVDDHVAVASAPAIPPVPPRSDVIFSPREDFHPVNVNSMSEDRSFHYSDSHSETKIINFNPINMAALSIGTSNPQPSRTMVDILTSKQNEPTTMLYYAFFKALAKR